MANNLDDMLLATFRRIMSMADFQTSWIQVDRLARELSRETAAPADVSLNGRHSGK